MGAFLPHTDRWKPQPLLGAFQISCLSPHKPRKRRHKSPRALDWCHKLRLSFGETDFRQAFGLCSASQQRECVCCVGRSTTVLNWYYQYGGKQVACLHWDKRYNSLLSLIPRGTSSLSHSLPRSFLLRSTYLKFLPKAHILVISHYCEIFLLDFSLMGKRMLSL